MYFSYSVNRSTKQRLIQIINTQMQGTGRSFYWSQWVLDWSPHFIYSVVRLQWKKKNKSRKHEVLEFQFRMLANQSKMVSGKHTESFFSFLTGQWLRKWLSLCKRRQWAHLKYSAQFWAPHFRKNTGLHPEKSIKAGWRIRTQDMWGTAEEAEDVQSAGGWEETRHAL